MSDYIRKSAVIELIESKMTDGCLGTEDETFVDGHGLVDDISDLPTLDEKEIIRKPFERVVERLESELKWTRAEQSIECTRHNGYGSPLQSKNSGKIEALKKTIEIVKEECGINE